MTAEELEKKMTELIERAEAIGDRKGIFRAMKIFQQSGQAIYTKKRVIEVLEELIKTK